MIVESNNSVPAIDGIIMIDCWEPKNGQEKIDNGFFIKLIANAMNHDLKAVVNAAYNVELSTQDPSIQNTFKLYCWDQGIDNTNNTEIILNLIKYCAARNTSSKLISETLLKHCNSVMLLDLKDFLFHWKYNLESKVNNWLIVGQSWRICVHERPLGLERIFDHVTDDSLNFYVVPELIRTDSGNTVSRDDFRQDWLPWQEIPGFGYRLVTKAEHHWTNALDFYKKFIADGKIHVTIHCCESNLALIPQSDDTFEITCKYEHESDWQFSYTRLLGVYNEEAVALPNSLRVWVFDITVPLDLRKLLSSATTFASAYQTQDESVLMFETSHISSIETIENFVK